MDINESSETQRRLSPCGAARVGFTSVVTANQILEIDGHDAAGRNANVACNGRHCQCKFPRVLREILADRKKAIDIARAPHEPREKDVPKKHVDAPVFRPHVVV